MVTSSSTHKDAASHLGRFTHRCRKCVEVLHVTLSDIRLGLRELADERSICEYGNRFLMRMLIPEDNQRHQGP